MPRSYYSDNIRQFLATPNKLILGILINNHQFELKEQQRNVWIKEIEILKEEFKDLASAHIIFEYSIPRMGKRSDVILILNGLVFVIEFKLMQSSIAQLQLKQDQLESALDNLVTQDQLQDTEDELQSSIAQLQARQNQLQTSLAAIQTQLQDTLANVVTQEELNQEFDNLLVTVQQLIENQEPIIPECPTFIQLPGGQIFAELKRDSSTRMIVGGPVDDDASGNIGPVHDVCIVPPNAFQQNLPN